MNRQKPICWILSEDISTPANIKIMSDSRSGVTIEADLQDTSEWNRNKRKYPTPILKKGLNRENIQEVIQKKSWFGEAGHPIDPSVQRQMTVKQENISHRILNFNFRGSIVHGTVKTTPTVQGRFMRDMILDDDPMISAFSLRAVGPVQETPQGKLVQDPLTVVTYDWVFYPSHRKAYQTEIVKGINENGNCLMSESGILIPIMESAIDYISEESKEFKLISETFELCKQNAILSEDCRNVIISNNTETSKTKIIMPLEEYCSNEICDYFDKFKLR